ncbi:MAG: Ppx/GppA phosphatase family protein [Vulcanimicrobiaceae bacterium]
MMKKRAVISIGTNSTRALLAAFEDGNARIVAQRSIGTRIGEGLKESGHLGDVPMQRTLDAIREHYEAFRNQADSIVAIATSALRRADNAPEFIARVREIIGSDIAIIGGDDEARYSFLGAVAASPADGTFGVVDTGGGSTEYAAGTRDRIERLVSCEIGAVRLTELFPALTGQRGPVDEDTLARANAKARSLLEPIGSFAHVDTLLFVGGSATTLASMLRGDRDLFATFPLLREDLRKTLARLLTLDLDARKSLPGMNPQRADILPAGLIVLDAVFSLTGHDRAAVSTSDLLFGYLIANR